MTAVELDDLVERFGADVVTRSRVAYFDEALSEITAHRIQTEPPDPHQTGLASALERIALDLEPGESRQKYADEAFLCRRSASDAGQTDHEVLLDLLMLCVDGLLSGRSAELAMLLQQRSDLDRILAVSHSSSWHEQLELRTMAAFVLLCRKNDGWSDIRSATEEIQALRQLQTERRDELGSEIWSVARVLTLFNLARIVDISAQFLIGGEPSDPIVQIDRHWSQARRAIEVSPDTELSFLNDALHAGALALVRGSVWHNTRQLGTRFRAFIDEIAGAHRTAPILELWPSQRAALEGNLLDPAKRAIVVEMPTSSGKTLIAEFSIVQALALEPDAAVAYVVPTRALVNQVTARLRRDFVPLEYSVEAAVPAYELDPTEDTLLRQNVDILVVTPEKLDLLVRMRHPVVASISLVVADEAHNIADGHRGARLELLLAMLRRERSECRFLLLTPFVPNGAELALWLGDDPEGRIEVGWRPSERLAAAASFRKRPNGPYELKMRTLPSATNVDLRSEIVFDVSDAPSGLTKSKKGISVAAAIALAERGGVLVLERGRSYAEDRAGEIAPHLPTVPLSEFGVAVSNFVKSELGNSHPLPGLLERGAAFHHAGLPHDIRFLVELMIEQGQVRVACGTTTLAQGVNFPIASVIVESLQKYVGPPKQWQRLSYAEFWNIAGRAGRALKDRLGLVVFPTRGPSDVDDVRDLLREEAEQISSALMEALATVGGAVEDFNLGFVTKNPALSVFLQYLTHALRVAGHEATSADMEDLLRSSYVYSQARAENRDLAEKLVTISRTYLDQARDRDPGYLALADGTGFSLATVDMLYARQQQSVIGGEAFWSPRSLFADDLRPLTSVIEILADVPELELGKGDSGSFDPEAVAGIVRDWVRGADLREIADTWFAYVDDDVDRIRQASHYVHSRLVAQIPWGMGVMQRLTLGEDDVEEVGHVPSLVFYGVPSKEAVGLRMAGVPRIAAEGLAGRFRTMGDGVPVTFDAIRDWLRNRTVEAWDSALPAGVEVTGTECRDIWRALIGENA